MAGGGTVPQALSKVVGRVGRRGGHAGGATARARSQWLAEHLTGGPVRLDGPAAARLSEHLGGDMGRLEGLLDTLASAYGPGATVTPADLEPFLGEAGSLAPWDLTDAIDAGGDGHGPGRAPPDAGGRRRPPAAWSWPILHRHYRQMLRLDGSGVTSPEEAAEVLGMRSAFPAKKALAQSPPVGDGRIARAVQLLAEADLDLRGATVLPGETVLEVLVARLSRLSAAAASGGAGDRLRADRRPSTARRHRRRSRSSWKPSQ